MDNKLETLKKALDELSIEDFTEKKEDKEIEIKIDSSSIDWNTLLYSNNTASAATISTAASSGGWTFSGPSGNLFSTGPSGIVQNQGTYGAGLHVKGDAEFEGDIKVKGTSLTDRLTAIEKRLSILVPDPAKLEHYEALKKAYEHYKTLEALCGPPDKEEK